MATDERKQERERRKALKAEYSKLLEGSPVDPRQDSTVQGEREAELGVSLYGIQSYREYLAKERMRAMGFGAAGGVLSGAVGSSMSYEPMTPTWRYNEVKAAMTSLAAELLEALPELLLARESKLHDAYKRVMRIMEEDTKSNDPVGSAQMQAAQVAMATLGKAMSAKPIYPVKVTGITTGGSTSEANAGTV